MKQYLGLLLAAVLFIGWLSGRADACMCSYGGPPVCQAYADASAVFIGVVSEISETKRPGPSKGDFYPSKLVRLSVVEMFKGVAAPEIDIETGNGSGDCGYLFERGKRYLVYGYGAPRSDQHMGTNICTRTKPIEQANEDLDYLRGLPESASKSRISGTVIQYTNERQSNSYKKTQPMAGVKVVITGNGLRFETATDEQGAYRVVGLPPGVYKVTPVLPDDLTVLRWDDKDVDYVEAAVTAGGCAAANISVETDGRIGGTVLDNEGKPAEGIQIDLVPLHLVGTAHGSEVIESSGQKTDRDGHYQFVRITPGQYYLGVNLRYEPTAEIPFKRTYYPGTPDRDQAVVIDLKQGQKLVDYTVILPPAIPLRPVTGVFLWSNGQPVKEGHVYLTDSAAVHGGHIYSSADVDENGRFSFKTFDGVRCWIHGNTYSTAGGRMHFVDSEPFSIEVNADTQPVKVIAPIPHDTKQ
jgi:hypothetical protein